jgi:copper chaperone CopZ
MPGVQSAVVDVPARTLSVDGDAGEAAVRASIEEAGYDVAGVTSPGDHA